MYANQVTNSSLPVNVRRCRNWTTISLRELLRELLTVIEPKRRRCCYRYLSNPIDFNLFSYVQDWVTRKYEFYNIL